MHSNPKQTGEVSEAKVVSALTERGYTVSVPFGENCRYDLIADDGDELYRIQVKTSRDRGNGAIVASLTRTTYNSSGATNSAYEKGELDAYCIYSPKTDEVYWLPFEDAPENSVTLRLEQPQNNQSDGIRLAEEYAV